MVRTTSIGLFIASVMIAAPAMAMDRYGTPLQGARSTIADPDSHLERMAAASTPSGSGHGKPQKSARSILKDDPYLRQAFSWLDNK